MKTLRQKLAFIYQGLKAIYSNLDHSQFRITIFYMYLMKKKKDLCHYFLIISTLAPIFSYRKMLMIGSDSNNKFSGLNSFTGALMPTGESPQGSKKAGITRII